MNSFWNERYSEKEFVYGESPNVFFADAIAQLQPGKIILPCDGEGRNAVYAARQGWNVQAFDLSEAGKVKADGLALKYATIIDFQIEDAAFANYPDAIADVVALIYTHLPVNVRKALHRNLIKWLKPGGKLILETFCPDQLKNSSGGPKDINMLYTKEILKEDFKDLRMDSFEYIHIHLSEGKYHEGPADVIRMVATKI
jgi:cyclopropane fatty-acyl-phospholipid synthase-like methyltransferase